jgi:hypothetical protein
MKSEEVTIKDQMGFIQKAISEKTELKNVRLRAHVVRHLE